MPKYVSIASWVFAATFAIAGTACAVVDLNDHWPVDETPNDTPVTPSGTESINEAWRSLEDFQREAQVYIDRRNEDILDEAKKVAVIKGAVSSGLTAVHETVGQMAGPWAPLLMLISGRAMKRRGDKTPQEHQAEIDRHYDMGVVEGQKYIEAAKQIVN